MSSILVRAKGPPYRLAGILYFLLKSVIKYRKNVIDKNISIVFPDISIAEIIRIRKLFYRQFARNFVEILYGYKYPERILDRVQFNPMDKVNQMLAAGKNVIICGGHFYNWEWVGAAFPQVISHDVIGVYKPLNNKYFDEYFRHVRAQLGLTLLPMGRTTQMMVDQHHTPTKSFALILGSDQSPSDKDRAIWADFFNIRSGFFKGLENFTKQYDVPAYYMHIDSPQNGKYVVTATELKNENGSIMPDFVRKLEQSIKKNPESWLWSHKRWKLNFIYP